MLADCFYSHLSFEELVLDSFPPRQTTKASPEDQTHIRETTLYKLKHPYNIKITQK